MVQQLDLLFSGYGFNYYKSENRARADDLLVRQQAAGSLSQAFRALSDLHAVYRLRYLPPPSRENPFPPPEESQRAAEILTLRDRIDRMAAAIHGMEVPTQDTIWKRMRREIDVLTRLLSLDYLLITYCERIREWAASLTCEEWRAEGRLREVESQVRELDDVMRERRQILVVL